jgi:hypothetical protein
MSSSHVHPGRVERGALAWERWGATLSDWLPFGALAVSWVLGLVLDLDQIPWTSTVETSLLVILAAAWVYLLYTRAPRPRTAHPVRMIAYFLGLLALAGVLMTRHPIFLVFAVAGYYMPRC